MSTTGLPPRKRSPALGVVAPKRGKEASRLCRINTGSSNRKQAIPLDLRPYQNEAVAAVIEGFKEFQRQLLVAPTGSGKTVIFAKLAQHYQPGRSLIIGHREELLQQAQDKILAATGLVAQIEAADRRASLDAPVVVASVQTLSRAARRERFPADHFALVVVDEAHHVLAASYKQVLTHFSGAKVLGVTATPDRGDKRALADYFENIAYEIGLPELIKAGYLSRIQVRTIPLQIDLRGVHSVAGDYSADELGHAIEPYLVRIADVVASAYAERKTLVFLPLCALSERFASLCRDRKLPAEHVDGASPDRAGVLARFRSGETTLVTNAMLWSEGFDEPSINCIIPLRPTKIRSLYAQQIGRGTRVYPSKKNLLVLDFLWITQRHSVISPASLVAANEEEARAMPRDGDLLDNAELYCSERLKALAQQLAENRRRKAQQYDLLEISVAFGDARLAGFEPSMRWHSDPVTPKQFDMLERCGINPCVLRGKGHASALIDHLENRRRRGLATYKQVRFLSRRGTPNAHALSFQNANALIQEMIAGHPAKRGFDGAFTREAEAMTLQEAKECVKIADLWRQFGYEGEPRKTCFCPFHENTRTPAFSVFDDGKAWKCHAGCGEGSVIDFLIAATGLSEEEACKEILRRAGSNSEPLPRWEPRTNLGTCSHDSEKEEKARKRESWPTFEAPAREEIKAIAELRGLSIEGVLLAVDRGLLYCADSMEGREWIVTDSRRVNAQGRLLSGALWAAGMKAKTLPGSDAAWPIGLREASPFPVIALVEGGPDMLAAFHLAWCADTEGQVAPVAMLGAGNDIPDSALRHFAEKQVRIFPHDDEAGREAGARWAAQLLAADVNVDGFSFAGLSRADGAAAKDLNDFAHIHPDQWEAQREEIEGAFSFETERQ